ncbi:MAG: hypothetical protein KY443_00515 [Actinobacteria bacterium]|nr:hypothetical protein [Actinomycetota bacterium]
MSGKQRLSATVDPELLVAAHKAVAAGRAENVSAWVNEALARQVAHDRRMVALAAFIGDFEAEHGAITEGEMAAAARKAASRATVVRPTGKPARRPRRTSA